MLGTADNPGIMVRSLNELFKIIENNNNYTTNNKIEYNIKYKLKISYIEIYNETIRDLLSEYEQTNLNLREDPSFGCQIVGVNEISVTSILDVFKLLK